MNTYKIGNKVNCIIRSYSLDPIGSYVFTYKNEPYTVLKDIAAQITYASQHRDLTSTQTVLSFDHDFVSDIYLSDVKINDKILNLIYEPNTTTKLANTFKNYMSDDNATIYLDNTADTIYQVFIYNQAGVLEEAYGTLSTTTPLVVQQANSNYLICYSYECATSVNLNRMNNYYVTLDLEVLGNENDQTQTMWIHLDKCALSVDKRLDFNDTLNTIDLHFKSIQSDDISYLTIHSVE